MPAHFSKLAGLTLGVYELRELIAAEADMIATYKGYQPALKRHVAVQVLNPAFNEKFGQGFLRAAEIIAELEHTNIVPIHDYAVQGQFAYIVTRLLEGGSLRQRVEAGPLPMAEVAAIVRQIGGALDYVHSRGMAHGDPSIANIAFDRWGSAYIADFHVAGFQEQVGSEMVATLTYTAPEKWNDPRPTPATDQYALGCIAYHMLTGHAPFQNVLVEMIFNPAYNGPPPPQTHRPEIPQAVNAVFQRVLAKDPTTRFTTVMDFARAFEEALRPAPQHVFISYSRRDKDYARRLADDLAGSSFKVWIDDQIDYGDAWFREIDKAINGCAAFVVIMTPDAYESEWVQKEILLAKRHKKPIFPLLLKGDEFAILIDIQFADVKDGAMPPADFYRRLRRAVYGAG